jgi:hypothetical protein
VVCAQGDHCRGLIGCHVVAQAAKFGKPLDRDASAFAMASLALADRGAEVRLGAGGRE